MPAWHVEHDVKVVFGYEASTATSREGLGIDALCARPPGHAQIVLTTRR